MKNKKEIKAVIIIILLLVSISTIFITGSSKINNNDFDKQANPTISSIYPINSSTGNIVNPILNVTISDADGENMNITWYGKVGAVYNDSAESIIINNTKCFISNRVPLERNLWFANGSYWAFFGQGVPAKRTVYSSSTDGITWSTPTYICDGHTYGGGADFCSWTYEDLVHTIWSYPDIYGGRDSEYRCGLLNSNGSITWLAGGEQVIDTSGYMGDPTICVNTTGYPFVGLLNITTLHKLFMPFVALSTTNNGTFTMKTPNYPLNMMNSPKWYQPIVLPLLNGNVYCVYAYSISTNSTGEIYGKLWNGTDWGTNEQAVDDDVMYSDYYDQFNAISIDNDVHVTFLQNVTYNIMHVYRNGTTGNWSEPQIINQTVHSETSPVLSKTSNGGLVCIWSNNDKVYYKMYYGGNWTTTPTEWIDSSIHNHSRLSVSNGEQNGKIMFTYLKQIDNNYSLYYNTLNNTGEKGWVIIGENQSVGNGTYECQVPYFNTNNYTYQWKVEVDDGAGTTTESYSFTIGEGEGNTTNYYIKPGYPNCTYGPPDFDQKQEDHSWEGIHPGDMISPQWFMCGPVALTNCLWWLDCKTNNNSNPNYKLPALCPGANTTDPNNVVPLVDWVAEYVNCTMPMGLPGEQSGTNASSMTEGILNILNATTGWSNTFELEVEGQGQWDATCRVNYTNITNHLDDCDDVVLLIGFWCGDVRVGGHYVQVAGYDQNNTALLFADPYFDNAEHGGAGWTSTHNHDFYGNASHNWTQNVSYDCYNVTKGDGPGESICDWYYLEDYPAGNGSNWSYINYWDNCYTGDAWGCNDDVNVTLEIAWYIKYDCCLNVNKTVWNSTSGIWEEGIYEDWIQNDTATFNISWHDCGSDVSDNITIVDTLYNQLEYDNGTGVFYHTNGTYYAREPDYITTEGGEFWHQHLYWNLTQEEADMVYCNTSYIQFNASTENVSGYAWNNVTVYVTEYDHEFWDSGCYNSSSAFVYISQLNESITCPCCGVEASNWNLTEHPTNNSLENSDWLEYESIKWLAYNETLNKPHNWSTAYRYDNSDGLGGDIAGLSYTISNHSSANRTSALLRMRYNHTGNTTTEPYVGVIYSFINNDEYDMVLFGTDKVFLLSKFVGGAMVNTKDGTAVAGPDDCYNYWEVLWSCDPGFDYDVFPNSNDTGYDGIWVRTLYNALAGTINAKAWPIYDTSTDFSYDVEPSGWICDNETEGGAHYENIQEQQAVCWGLVTWNPYDVSFTADFDKIDMWQLNYSRDELANASQIENHSVYGQDGIPLMEFPLHNISLKEANITLYSDCYWEYFAGNLSWDEYLDCITKTGINISSLFSMESRYYTPNISCANWWEWSDQNGSIYYYTSVLTNISAPYHETLAIHIEDTTDGTQDDYDAAVVAIDIDNDGNWDDNDVCAIWYSWYDPFWLSWQTNVTFYRGTEEVTPTDVDTVAGWEYALTYGAFESCMPPYHRNYWHRSYFIEAPRFYFEKDHVGSHQYLNTNDTFGLHVMTINRGMDTNETLTAVWENWNESNNYSLYNYYACDDAFGGHLEPWNAYMNITTNAQMCDFYNGTWTGPTETNMDNWGHGRIGPGWQMQDSYNEMNATKECNISQIIDDTTWHHVNYTINVSNTGSVNNTNVTVNDTLPEGCTYVMSSLPPANVTGSDRNYTFNVTANQKAGDIDSFNITINVTAGAAPSGTYLYNYINGTCLEGAFDLANDSFLYGSNTAPIINWTYPVNGSTSAHISFYNFSCYVYDINGDLMNVTFRCNKTTTWTGSWSDIGTNSSVPTGVYMCNQSFNTSQRYNTKWRWGNTTYYCRLVVDDGTVWENKTYAFRTGSTRYDMDTSYDVTATDVTWGWTNRQGEYSYLGIYDVDESGDITATDASIIWANRT